MKVVFVNPVAQLGGAEHSLLDILDSVPKKSDVAVVLFEHGPLFEEIIKLGVQVEIVPLPKALSNLGDSNLSATQLLVSMASVPACLTFFFRLRRTLQALNPEVIHTNGFKAHAAATLCHTKINTVWHIRDFVSNRKVMQKLLRLLNNRVSGIIANSNPVAEDIRKSLVFDKVKTIPNGINLDSFCNETSTINLALAAGLPEINSIKVGLIASYANWKGHEFFINAAKQTGPSFQFFIIGGPIYKTSGSQLTRDEIKTLIKQNQVEEKVGLLDWQNDMGAVYRGLDVVANTSQSAEPFGRTIAEAMACGKIVLVPDSSGICEFISHDQDGLIYKANDNASFISLVNSIEQREDLENLRSSAIESAKTQFDSKRLWPQILSAYSDFGVKTLT